MRKGCYKLVLARKSAIKVFIGPSKFDGIENYDDLELLPPAKRGDVAREAQLTDTAAIVLIDGIFGDTPSVLHKEILYCLSLGVYIAGSSSIGAIRAAEMEKFGMIGHGWIYDAYLKGRLNLVKFPIKHATAGKNHSIDKETHHLHSGTNFDRQWLLNLKEQQALVDDDDVALIYGPCELDYLKITEPMVNIFRTCERHINRNELLKNLVITAKKIHFTQRTFSNIRKKLELNNIYTSIEIKESIEWIQSNFIDQKKIDAMNTVELVINSHRCARSDSRVSRYIPQKIHTVFWDNLYPPEE